MVIKLDMLQTLALAVIVYYIGSFVKSKIKVLEDFCIPAPVVGGILFAFLTLILNQTKILSISMDNTLQAPFMLVFFTSIGLSANLNLIKKGSIDVLKFFLVVILLVVCQNVFGIIVAKLMGQHPLLGLLGGSISMVGGHGTGAAFGQLFENKYGFSGATTIAMAAATFGLVAGSLIGGPLGKRLVEKNNLVKSKSETFEEVALDKESVNFDDMFKTFTVIMICIAFGTILGEFFNKLGLTLPSYVNSMIIAAIVLNIGDKTKKHKINTEATDILGNIGLNVFLSMALINLRLWELKDVAGPILVILIIQCIIMIVMAYFVSFNLCGKDYDAAVLSAGFCGFGMGATPNGMANMAAMTKKYTSAPRAFFVLPIVGAFLIDLSNSIIITFILNVLKL